MNMVMTFILHPLSHYNSITEPHTRFLLSLLKHLTIDFPSHFILSIIDVHLDSASRDKLIFPSAITRMQQMDSAAPSFHSAPSRSIPSAFAPSSLGDVSLRDVMAQLQCMDARLDTLSTELYQVNVCVGRIARR